MESPNGFRSSIVLGIASFGLFLCVDLVIVARWTGRVEERLEQLAILRERISWLEGQNASNLQAGKDSLALLENKLKQEEVEVRELKQSCDKRR